MEVTQTLSDGLKREFRVVIPARELDEKVKERLDALKNRVRINGFRPGKVPVEHLRRVYGRAVMAETIDAAVNEGNAKIVSDNQLKLALAPKITLPTEPADVENVLAGKSDLAFTVAMEILPAITLADFKTISVEKLVADVSDAEVEEALGRIADQNRPYADKGEGAKAAQGDRVTISFVGKIAGKPFEGGTGEDIAVQIGSGTFIPGFEDQLVGIGAGEQRIVKASFPANYMSEALAGKDAEFDVTAKSIEAPREVTIDDEFAKSLGMESLAKLKDAVRDRIKREHDAASRAKLKRALLDALDEKHKFEVSPSLLEQEFENLWKTAQDELKSQGRTFADEGTTEEAAREEYRRIADRRVRLGLVLAEIGEKNNIKVTDEEVNRAFSERLRQFPGQEQRIYEYYKSNPEALAGLRAPIFEEKVVDFILELAKVSEKSVSREELYRTDEDAKTA
ncbi:MAG: trigger factor [Pseudorhodoplanes sp.]|nr:trigger factor [Pseudorhodoplanes sp.]